MRGIQPRPPAARHPARTLPPALRSPTHRRHGLDVPLPHLDRERLRAIMLRSGYSAEQEREAELLASMIIER